MRNVKQLTEGKRRKQETQVLQQTPSPSSQGEPHAPLPVSYPLPSLETRKGILGQPDSFLAAHAITNQAAQGGRSPDSVIGQIAFDARLSALYSMDPQDAIEGHLINQISMINEAMIDAMRRLTSADSLPLRETYSRMLNQLGRTSSALVQTLGSYRGRGEQRITVQHVNVNEGGQAIVGNVTAGGVGDNK